MPHTAKGEKIVNAMKETYGSSEKAEQVLHASANAGKITGIDAETPVPPALAEHFKKMTELPDPLAHGKANVAPHNAFTVKDYLD